MFVIDHHASSSDEWPEDTMLLSSDASSTCQIILELILRDSGRIPLEWAEMLYAGIVTDTGRFKHGSENGHRSVVRLLDNSALSPEDVLQTIEGDGMPSDREEENSFFSVFHGDTPLWRNDSCYSERGQP